MSFRSRLTLFFVLIVIVPMASLTFVLFALIANNETGKADAALSGQLRAAINLSDDAVARAEAAAKAVGGDPELAAAVRANDTDAAEVRARQLLRTAGLKRVVVTIGEQRVLDVGTRRAIFPATLDLVDSGGRPLGQVQASVDGARRYESLADGAEDPGIVITREGNVLASTLDLDGRKAFPATRGEAEVGGEEYRTAAFERRDFGGQITQVTVLDPVARRTEAVRTSRYFAAALLSGFFILAFVFAVLVSRSLQRQIGEFLGAAQRVARGDFAARVPTSGNDEFAALGHAFNRMSEQLESRLTELRAEQSRVASAMRRTGEVFASNLDRDALLALVLRTALDGLGGGGGRASLRPVDREGPLRPVAEAELTDRFRAAINSAETLVLESGQPEEVLQGTVGAMAHPLLRGQGEGKEPEVEGVVAVARDGEPFTAAERELFNYLAGQASVSVENVELHETVERQALTDDLTGLSNRRRFEEVLEAEVERSRRLGSPVGLVMLDLDDFKVVNDTYGHQAGDLVLQEVARILQRTSREIDLAARYGGEELAVILPGTDLDGANDLAERLRMAIEALQFPVEGQGSAPLRVTASLGAATLPGSGSDPSALIEAADAALYEAKRQGKNRTVRAGEVPSA